MADTELNFSQRWIDLEALYRHRIPLRKIFVPLGAWSPNQICENL